MDTANIISLILVIVAILLILTIVLYDIFTPETYCVIDKNKSNLGNLLVRYFCTVAFAMQKGKEFKPVIYSVKSNKIPFLNKLPENIEYTKPVFPVQVQRPFLFSKDLAVWEDTLLLESIQPLIASTVRSILPNISVNIDFDALIHFRCSDIPFNRHPKYGLQKYKWYRKALELASKRINISKIAILSCTDHTHRCTAKNFNSGKCNNNNNKEACAKYAKLLQEFLISLGYLVEIKCNSIETDFVTMINAPCLISSGSSMSFMAALTSDNLRIVSVLDTKQHYQRPNLIYLNTDFLNHSEVSDYYNVTHVNRMLNSN